MSSAIIVKPKDYQDCKTKFCRGRYHIKSHSRPYCQKCNTRRWKEKYPGHYAYNNLRHRAKQRGHSFTLTRERFMELWNQGLKDNHGKGAGFLSVDRIRENEGYHDGNVQLLIIGENIRKHYVPYFQNQKPRDEQDIHEAELAVAASMNQPDLQD